MFLKAKDLPCWLNTGTLPWKCKRLGATVVHKLYINSHSDTVVKKPDLILECENSVKSGRNRWVLQLIYMAWYTSFASAGIMSFVLQYQEQYQKWIVAKADAKMVGKLNNTNG